MITMYKSLAGYVSIPAQEQGCWINVLAPTPSEIEQLKSEFNVPEDIIRDILDVDERPRVEYDEDWTLILLRIPVAMPENGIPYQTIPLGVFVTSEFTLTLCRTKNEVLTLGQPSIYRENKQQVHDILNFLFHISLRSSQMFLRYLKQINQQTTAIEHDLDKSIRNKELNRLLKMEKCLVYFITSLKGNELVLARLGNAKKNTISEENEDLLEDAVIENKQALEMARIYSDIQSGMMDVFASVISNNLNVVMKQLASISIILMIPTLIASLFGMNVPNYLEGTKLAFPVIITGSALFSILGILIFRKRDLF